MTHADTTQTTPTSSAQSATRVGLTREDLTEREVKVLGFLTAQADEGATAVLIARGVFPGVRPITKAKSWARNTLRRLVREGFVRKAGGVKTTAGLRKSGHGVYKVTKKGAVSS